MPGRTGDGSSTLSIQMLGEGARGRKRKVRGTLQGKRDWIRGHLLAELAAPQHNEFETGQFFESHRTTRMNPRGADADFRPETELIAVIEPSGGIDKHGAGIDFFEKSHRTGIIRRHNGLRMPRPIPR